MINVHQLSLHECTHTAQVTIISIINHIWTLEDMCQIKEPFPFSSFFSRICHFFYLRGALNFSCLLVRRHTVTAPRLQSSASLPFPPNSLGLVFSLSSHSSITPSVLSPSLGYQISLQKEQSRFKGESRLV